MSGFLPPEAAVIDDEIEPADVSGSWDIAVRYKDLRTRRYLTKRLPALREISCEEILRRARSVVGSVVRPCENKSDSWERLPSDAINPELDVERTLEENPEASDQRAADLWAEFGVRRSRDVVLCVDTSLSMNGEKMALTAVAIGVMALQFEADPFAVIAFENSAQVLKESRSKLNVAEVIKRFLDMPSAGYTDLENGLSAALARCRSKSTCVLITDGKYTAGRDPSYLASRFSRLIVMKVGRDRSGLGLCHDMAKNGSGFVEEVPDHHALPASMYSVVKSILRGRSA